MIAITSASDYLKNWRLTECDIYVTLEPCIMCTGALLAARVKNIYFSAFDTKFGACGSVHNLAERSKTNHTINVYSGLLVDESRLMLDHFFKKKETAPPEIGFLPEPVNDHLLYT